MAMAYLTTEEMMLLVQSEERRSKRRTKRFVRRKFTVNKLTLLFNFLRQLERPNRCREKMKDVQKTYPMLSETRARNMTTACMSVLAQAMRKTHTKASARQKHIISADSLSPLLPLDGRLAFFQYIHP